MKWMFSACLVLACTALIAQQNTGMVTYEEAFNLDAEINVEEEGGEDPFADMPPEIVEQIKAAMATLPTNKKQLLFSPAATVMSNAMEEEKATPPGQNMARVMIMVDSDQGNDIIHHDLASGKVTEQRELLDKKFLIERENDELAWKITGNQKQLLDQLVIEATTTLDSAEVVAWFAPLIPVSSGPQGMGGLPGLILELSLQGGEVTYTATGIDFRAVEADELNVPKKGKKVTAEAFEEIQEERMQDMGGGGGDVQMMIRIDN